MEIGKESWKWGLVLILLAVFLLIAHQAYVAVTSQEDFQPPEDYLQGDSYDVERNPGPGAGQPTNIPEAPASGAEAVVAPEAIPTELPSSLPDSFQNIGQQNQPAPDWSDVKDPSR